MLSFLSCVYLFPPWGGQNTNLVAAASYPTGSQGYTPDCQLTQILTN